MTASLQNTLWNRYCALEKRRTDFLIAQDSARQDLIAVEEALSVQVEDDELVPDGADYAGNGCWRYRGFAIQAIEQENPRDGRRFRFVAVAKAKKLLLRRSDPSGGMARWRPSRNAAGIGQAGDGAPTLRDRSHPG